MMGIPFTDLKKTFELYQQEYEEATLRVLRSGWYVMGNELRLFESEFAKFLGMNHCVGCGCGQDALILAVRCLGIGVGDEVIVAGNTYIATVIGVTENGATPVFIDCNEWYQIDENRIEEAISANTKAVLVTNLYGQCTALQVVRDICDRHGLYMLEDCAQSHGASFGGRLGGTVGDISCFSFYPTKPLGAFGDAGAIVTNNDLFNEKLRMLRNYGSRQKYINEMQGINSRLDEVQAAMLRVGLNHIREFTDARVEIATRYLSEIKNPLVELPKTREGADHVYHIFAIQCIHRDALKAYMIEKGIGVQIHYPVPPHQAQCYANEDFAKTELPNTVSCAHTLLSLPIYAGMPDGDVDAVIDAVNGFKIE